MIAAALCFWSTSTKTFDLGCGPMGPSVMDVSSLTTSSDVKFNADNAHIFFDSYARREMGKGEIRGQEHSAFLLLFLCPLILSNPSNMMTKE